MRHCRVNHCDKWATQAQDVDGEGGCVCRWGQGKEYAGTLKFPLNFIVNLKSEVKVLSRVCLFVSLWTVVCQVPLSMEFSRSKYWSG